MRRLLDFFRLGWPASNFGLPFFARYGLVVLPDPECFAFVEDLCQGGPWDEFEYMCPSLETRTPLHPAGSRELERDVNAMANGDGQLCRPMHCSAAMSCANDKNSNATEVHQELVTIDILDILLQVQGLQQSSSLHDPLLGVSSHELATCEGAEMRILNEDTTSPSRFAQAL